MPRVNTVQKCRKSPGTCGRCGTVIAVGQPYKYWAFMVGGRGGPKHIRCGKPECAPRPQDWTDEAASQGVSWRISQIPRGFEPGKTLVLVAHRKHRQELDGKTWVPAVFHAFVAQRLEYVVRGDETESQLARLVQRGAEPVVMKREGHLPGMDGAPTGKGMV